MAVSIDTVNEIIVRTLKALRDMGDTRTSEIEQVLLSYTATGRFIQPEASWLMCELCRALGEAAALLKSAGEENLAGQITNLVLADALFAIATESHFAAYRHPDPERTAEMVTLSDEIRGAASRAGMLVALEVTNPQLLSTLNRKVAEKSSQVGKLQNLVTTDPHCDHSLFGPVFDRVQQFMPIA